MVGFGVREMDRWSILERVRRGDVTQVQGAESLGLSVRQVRRLLVRTEVVGMEGLRSGPRGGNRAMDPVLKDKVLSLITTQYHDLGPTLAAEKLQALHRNRAFVDEAGGFAGGSASPQRGKSASVSPAKALFWRADSDRRVLS